MFTFAAKVANQLDELTGANNLATVLETFKDHLRKEAFSAERIQQVCKDLHAFSGSSAHKKLDESELGQATVEFLLNIASEVSDCSVDHFKSCEVHRQFLAMTFGVMLAGLIGTDVKHEFDRLKSFVDFISRVEVVISPRGTSVEQIRMANWGSLLTDPEMLKHVSRRIFELSESRQAATLQRLAVLVGSLEKRPDHDTLEAMIRRAVLGMGKTN